VAGAPVDVTVDRAGRATLTGLPAGLALAVEPTVPAQRVRSAGGQPTDAGAASSTTTSSSSVSPVGTNPSEA